MHTSLHRAPQIFVQACPMRQSCRIPGIPEATRLVFAYIVIVSSLQCAHLVYIRCSVHVTTDAYADRCMLFQSSVTKKSIWELTYCWMMEGGLQVRSPESIHQHSSTGLVYTASAGRLGQARSWPQACLKRASVLMRPVMRVCLSLVRLRQGVQD